MFEDFKLTVCCYAISIIRCFIIYLRICFLRNSLILHFAAVAWSLIAVGWGVSFVEAGSVVVVLLVCVDIGFAVLSTFALFVFALISDVSLAVVFNWGVSIVLFFRNLHLHYFSKIALYRSIVLKLVLDDCLSQIVSLPLLLLMWYLL